jgi:hypothetical protein
MAASSLRLGGEQRRMRTGPHQTGPGHVSAPDPRLRSVQGPYMFRPGTLGPPLWATRTPYGGVRIPFLGSSLHTCRSGTTLGVRTAYPEVRHSPAGVRTTIDALEYITFSGHVVALDLPMWWSRALVWTQSSHLGLGRAVAWSHTQHFYHVTKG